jgi:hypothetical protein
LSCFSISKSSSLSISPRSILPLIPSRAPFVWRRASRRARSRFSALSLRLSSCLRKIWRGLCCSRVVCALRHFQTNHT